MPVESATYIAQLNALAPGGPTDPFSQGDDHLRLLKSVLKATFPNATGAVTPTPAEFNTLVGATSAIQTQLDLKALIADAQKKNHIWNGGMDCWQDGTSEAGITATSRRVADGFIFEVNDHGTWTVERSTTVPTVAQAGRNLSFSLRALNTVTDTSVAAGSYVGVGFYIEGFDWQDLYLQPIHISVWVRAKLVGTYCLTLRNSGTPDRSFVFPYTIDLADTWELKQFVLSVFPSGGTWNFQTGVGLSIGFTLVAGATYQTTGNVWQSGNFLATSAQANLAATVNNDFYLADLRLHRGAARSPVYVRSFQEVLREAQRRFAKTFDYETKPAQNVGFAGSIYDVASSTSVGVRDGNWRFPVSMRAAPSITFYNPSAANANWSDGVAAAGVSLGDSGVIIQNSASVVDGSGASIHVTADARL